MALARALITLYHQNIMLSPGDEFEYDYDGKLDPAVHGMEWVTKQTTKAARAAKASALAALRGLLGDAKAEYESLRLQLEADPTRNDLVTLVLEAEDKVKDAEKAVADAQGNTVEDDDHDLV